MKNGRREIQEIEKDRAVGRSGEGALRIFLMILNYFSSSLEMTSRMI